MKFLKIRQFVLILQIFALLVPAQAAVSLEEFLRELPLKNIKILEKEAFYSQIYEVMFDQPIDHKHPELGSFAQRIYISHVDVSKPVVLVTEGYSAEHYYTSEPAFLLKCNQIIAEHRYFGASTPDSIQWEYLNTWQSASDFHCIIEKFKAFYQQEWITTGISKGGQTVLFHSYYYPDDVDIRIPYVAPLNFSTEDRRVFSFLNSVGTAHCRRKIHRFQKRALKNEKQLIPAFRDFSTSKGFSYKLAGGMEQAFEYCVLEYSFSFWQWGYADCKNIPGKKATPQELIRHLNMVAGFDYFSDAFIEEYRPFFYQAYTEMGYYAYNLNEFSSLLQYVKEPGFEFTLPKNINITFDNSIVKNVDHYLRNDAKNFIFIYGEYDTWSSTAVDPGENTNCKIFYKEKGSHRSRIGNMDENQQKEITDLINSYLQ